MRLAARRGHPGQRRGAVIDFGEGIDIVVRFCAAAMLVTCLGLALGIVAGFWWWM